MFTTDQRLKLQTLLELTLGSGNVYFQPPASKQIEYPAIVYKRDTSDTQFAGNVPYRITLRYQVTVIDRDPDSDIPVKVSSLPLCLFNRHFTANNLHHDVFHLYF